MENITLLETYMLIKERQRPSKTWNDYKESLQAEDIKLTKRELQIMKKIAAGFTSQEVADSIGKSKRVVDFHLSNVYQKLGVSRRVLAINILRKMELLP